LEGGGLVSAVLGASSGEDTSELADEGTGSPETSGGVEEAVDNEIRRGMGGCVSMRQSK
jgi:hypothetical protein